MSAKVSDEIFDVFKWSKCAVTDMSWDCVQSDDHGGKKNHPSDCVFFYRDPYTNEMVYVNTDLKSYKKNTINKEQIYKALYSLSYATDCANANHHWSELFKPEVGFSVKGMLFVYNHCGEYKGDFEKITRELTSDHNKLSDENSIYICSPSKVRELCSIAADIRQLISKKELPDEDNFCFYHPNQMLQKNHFDSHYNEPATLEVISAPWIIIKHEKSKKSKSGYLIYYTREGDTVDEFIYFIDALSYYQIINNKEKVRIKLTKKNNMAALNLRTAIEGHLKDLGYCEEKSEEAANEMVMGTIATTIPQLSERELGVIE